MAIKISGTDVIDQSRSIVNAQDGYFAGVVTAANFSGSANLSFTSQNVTSVSGITTINLSLGSVVYFTHNTDTTVAFANTSTSQEVIFIRTKDDTDTVRSLVWPSSVKWGPYGDPPALVSSASTTDAQGFRLITRDSGVTWYGSEVFGYYGSGTYLFAMGAGSNGYLGTNDTIDRSSPTIVGGTNWDVISSGDISNFGTKTSGTLWSWGLNGYGQLGLNDLISRSSPVQIGSGTDWSYVDASYPYCMALKSTGTLWSWGYNPYGNLGQNNASTAVSRSSPIQVGTDNTWSKISNHNSYQSFAIKTNNTLWAWGLNASHGNLGLNDLISRSSPVQIGSGTDWSSIKSGSRFNLAIKTNNTLWSWGYNAHGQLGQNNRILYSSPIQIGSGTDWSKVCPNNLSTYAIKTNGTLWAWGHNGFGQLGQNNGIFYSSPIQIGSGTDWSEVVGQQSFVIATKTNGTLWSWGYNPTGNLGQNDRISTSSPVQIGTGDNWVLENVNSDSNSYNCMVKKLLI